MSTSALPLKRRIVIQSFQPVSPIQHQQNLNEIERRFNELVLADSVDAGDAIINNGGVFDVQVDGSTIDIVGNQLHAIIPPFPDIPDVSNFREPPFGANTALSDDTASGSYSTWGGALTISGFAGENCEIMAWVSGDWICGVGGTGGFDETRVGISLTGSGGAHTFGQAPVNSAASALQTFPTSAFHYRSGIVNSSMSCRAEIRTDRTPGANAWTNGNLLVLVIVAL